ncbi:hypothetical protein [Saccharothrix deserti]|uniref:hypothetical protein n=1 Tax=Saccharothrix deserti TaxID=2593674 RepID=UPI00131D3795|nr:hypothetical protein [Saccharothrix deserti]
MGEPLYETPEPERPRLRVSPHVLLAASGVAVSTIFATVASLAGASPDASPAEQQPREDVVNRNTLTTTPRDSFGPSVTLTTTETSTTTTTTETTEATTTSRRTRVTTVTRPDGTTTTTTVDDPQPQPTTTTPPVDPPTTNPPVTTTTPPVVTTTNPPVTTTPPSEPSGLSEP